MTVDSRRAPRWSALPRLVRHAPPAVWLGIGIAVIVLGLLIVIRPLTSLWLLAVYVGVSAIVSGVLDLVRASGRWRRWIRAAGVVWIAGGAGILIWFRGSLDLLPNVIALLLLLGGVVAFAGIRTGRASERVLTACWGVAQLAFGALALLWPDMTLLLVAIVFGVRTVVFGVELVVRAFAESGRRQRGPAPEPGRARIAWVATGRYALAALLLVLAGGGWGLNAWLERGAPVIDAFYDPPDHVPAGPGHLIRESEYTGRTPPGAEVRRILYTTTDTHGDAAVASALVIEPEGGAEPFSPVIAWNHGTTGVARGCAPSLTDAAATKWAIPSVDQAIDRGWIVVTSDYSGQGAPGTFPYLIGEGEARSTLDAVRALREVPRLYPSTQTAVWGHSQGGHAALWTAEIADSYAPEIDVVATAALAPVADPRALASEVSVTGSPLLTVLVAWVLVPYADTYPDVSVDRYVAPGAESIVREMTQRCPTEPGVMVSVLAALGVSADRPLYVGDLTTGALGRRLAENAASGPWDSPLLVSWGAEDEVIPVALQTEFVERACAEGNTVRIAPYDGLDHTGVMLPHSGLHPLLISWTQARFAGVPAPSDCAVATG